MWARSTQMLAILELISAWPASRYFDPPVLRSQMNMLWKSWTLIFLLSHQQWCKANLASSVLSLMDLMWPCLVEPVEKTRRLHITQDLNPGASTQCAHVGYPGVE